MGAVPEVREDAAVEGKINDPYSETNEEDEDCGEPYGEMFTE